MKLVEEERVELSFAGCRPAVLPLNDSPTNWLRAGELNATRMAYEASMTPVHLPALKKLVREAGVEPAASRLSVECSNRAELFPAGARGDSRNPGLRITSAALFHLSYSGMERARRIELRCSERRSDAQP